MSKQVKADQAKKREQVDRPVLSIEVVLKESIYGLVENISLRLYCGHLTIHKARRYNILCISPRDGYTFETFLTGLNNFMAF